MTVVTAIGKVVARWRLLSLLCEKNAPQKRPAQVLLGALFFAPRSAFSKQNETATKNMVAKIRYQDTRLQVSEVP